MTYAQWQDTTKTKIATSINLHNHLTNLSFFIMLSSDVGILGHTSQANYAAGNTFQDALARHRTALGLPTFAIDLGPVESIGFIEESDGDAVMNRLVGLGIRPMNPDHLLRILDAIISEPAQLGLDGSQIITCIPPYQELTPGQQIKRDIRFAALDCRTTNHFMMNAKSTGEISEASRLTDHLSQPGLSLSDASSVILAGLISKLADMFNRPTSDFDSSLAMTEYGLDSLVAVELRNWLLTAVKVNLSIFEILQSSSLIDFARLVASKSELVEVGASEDVHVVP